MKNIKAIISSR